MVAIKNPGVAKIEEDEANGWFCRRCNMKQNNRTSHCVDCDVCILEYDHHCPWIGKCVGKGNYFEFMSFLFSTVVFMTYNIIILTK